MTTEPDIFNVNAQAELIKRLGTDLARNTRWAASRSALETRCSRTPSASTGAA